MISFWLVICFPQMAQMGIREFLTSLIDIGDRSGLQGISKLGGGFKYILFSPLIPREMIQLDEHIFQMVGSTTNLLFVSPNGPNGMGIKKTNWLILGVYRGEKKASFHFCFPFLPNGKGVV